jgi:hypothetical protein
LTAKGQLHHLNDGQYVSGQRYAKGQSGQYNPEWMDVLCSMRSRAGPWLSIPINFLDVAGLVLVSCSNCILDFSSPASAGTAATLRQGFVLLQSALLKATICGGIIDWLMGRQATFAIIFVWPHNHE